MIHTALLALVDGSLFYGQSIGSDGEVTGEVVFNTSMTGYQEILTDPSYYQQIVTMTYPHIGNIGINLEDEESTRVFASGLIIKQLPYQMSNWRAKSPLDEYLREKDIVALADIDTRQLTRILRDKGAQNGCIISGKNLDADKAVSLARSFPGLIGADLAKKVSTTERYDWSDSIWSLARQTPLDAKGNNREIKVIAYDFGVKRNILRILIDKGCQVTVVPASTSAKEVLGEKPDGVFLSNCCGWGVTRDFKSSLEGILTPATFVPSPSNFASSASQRKCVNFATTSSNNFSRRSNTLSFVKNPSTDLKVFSLIRTAMFVKPALRQVN